ncbi:hypothetical protein N9L68_02380 [bacterium]|nr:hypothetical protein [bacterium]
MVMKSIQALVIELPKVEFGYGHARKSTSQLAGSRRTSSTSGWTTRDTLVAVGAAGSGRSSQAVP